MTTLKRIPIILIAVPILGLFVTRAMRPQTIALASAGPRGPIELVLILDDSNSVASQTRAVQTEARAFIEDLNLECNPHIRVAVVTFSDQARLAIPLTYDAKKLIAAIRLSGKGSTKIENGFQEAKKELANSRPKADQMVILVSDGQNNDGCEKAASGARGLGPKVRRYALCVSESCNAKCMRDDLASDDKYYHEAESKGKLKEAFQTVAAELGASGTTLVGFVSAYGKYRPNVDMIAVGNINFEKARTDNTGYYEMIHLFPGSYRLSTHFRDLPPPFKEEVTIVEGCNRHDVEIKGEPPINYIWPLASGNTTLSAWFDHEYPVANFPSNIPRPIDDVTTTMRIFNGSRSKVAYTGHEGLDIAVGVGSDVVASADGDVLSCDQADGFGTCVKLHHADGNLTRYAHLSEKIGNGKKPGTKVVQGEVIGRTGKSGGVTGAHLHFEVARITNSILRFDPMGWSSKEQDPWVKAGGPPSRYIFTPRFVPPSPLTETFAKGSSSDFIRAESSQLIPPILQDYFFATPDEGAEFVSDDGTVTVTLGAGTFVSPTLIMIHRVSEGNPQDSDDPSPILGSTIERFTSLFIDSTDLLTDATREPARGITISMRALVQADRPADFASLRLVREDGDSIVDVPSTLKYEPGIDVARVDFSIGQIGRYLLIANSVRPIATTVASPTATIDHVPSPSQTTVLPSVTPISRETEAPNATEHLLWIPDVRMPD